MTIVDLAKYSCGKAPAAHSSYGLALIKSKAGGPKLGEGQTMPIAELIADTTEAAATGNGALMVIKSLVPLTPGVDLAPAHDGKLKLPDGATLVDALALGPSGGTPLTGIPRPEQPDTGAVAATRIVDKLDPLKAEVWYTGALKGGDDSTAYDPSQASANIPKGAVLTPGAVNFKSQTPASDGHDGAEDAGDHGSHDSNPPSNGAAPTKKETNAPTSAGSVCSMRAGRSAAPDFAAFAVLGLALAAVRRRSTKSS
jgi:MYXO-CTERM domain-containing protein